MGFICPQLSDSYLSLDLLRGADTSASVGSYNLLYQDLLVLIEILQTPPHRICHAVSPNFLEAFPSLSYALQAV